MARHKKEMDQLTRIHIQQDKNDCFFGVGDIVRGKCVDGFLFDGQIICVEIKKEGHKLHPIMDLKQLSDSKVEEFGLASIWVENITDLEIIRFKGEETTASKE